MQKILNRLKSITKTLLLISQIENEQFLKEVGTGVEAFRNGDRLEVDLDIAERFVDSFADYERTNHYWITKVHGHSSRPSKNEQMHFKLDADR